MMKPAKLSIRWRLALWNVLAFAIILVAFGVGVYQLLWQAHFQMLDSSLERRADTLQAAILAGLSAEESIEEWTLKYGRHSDHFALICDGDQNASNLTAEISDEIINRLLPGIANHSHGTLDDPDLGRVRYLSREIQGQNKTLRFYILVELEHVEEELSLVGQTFLWAIPPALLLSAALSYWLAVQALSPVDQLRLKTDSIRASDLNLRIPVANPNDEIGQLTATINSLFARLEHAFDEIKRFSADASHELRTPIAIIRSEAEMVMQIDEEHSRTLGRMKSIVEECSRLTNLTTQLLALSRAESTKGNIKANSIHLASLLSEVVDSLSPQASLEGVRIEIRNADHTTCVWGDSESLRQVFYNLLDNALKYNRRNGSVVIESGSQDQKAIVVVSDTGIGIAAEYLPRVFDRFFRIPWEQSNRGGTSSELSVPGSGLGLSIVRQILYSHGGTCEIESEPGEGTRIRVSLPLA